MFYKQLNIPVDKKVNSVHLGGNLIVGKIVKKTETFTCEVHETVIFDGKLEIVHEP